MPRRNRPPKREVLPDARYNSAHVTMLINRIMRDGKKSTAAGIVYRAFAMVEERAKRSPVEVFEQALGNVMPVIEVKGRRVGGSTYQVPVEVPPYRRVSLGMRWILAAASNRGGRSFADKLANELMDAAANQGAAVKKREETHKMAEANRTFAHYRW